MFIKPPSIPTEDAALPTGEGFGGFWYVLSSHFFRLIGLNLLFIAGCIPVITIPASLAGMTAVLQKLLRAEHCYVFETYWKEFRTDFWKRALTWFGLQLIPAAIWYGASLFGAEDYMLLPVSVYIVYILMLCGYWMPQLAVLDLTMERCLRNAAALISLTWKTDLAILLIYGLPMLLWLIFWPYSTLLLLLGLCSVVQLAICAAVNTVIREKLLRTP